MKDKPRHKHNPKGKAPQTKNVRSEAKHYKETKDNKKRKRTQALKKEKVNQTKGRVYLTLF